jgi:hypothetical protein
MQTLTENRVLTAEQIEQYERDGYFIARGLVSPEETQKLLDHFMQMHEQTVPGHYEPPAWEDCNDDVLRRYPRIMMPHRYDETSKSQMLDARYEGVLHDLFGEEALASQSMFYFKPPGARGQALHQDNFYFWYRPAPAWRRGFRWMTPMKKTVACSLCPVRTKPTSVPARGRFARLVSRRRSRCARGNASRAVPPKSR